MSVRWNQVDAGLVGLLLMIATAVCVPAYKMPMPDDVAAGTEADRQRWLDGEMREASTLQQRIALERHTEREAAQGQLSADLGMQAIHRQKLMADARERNEREQTAQTAKYNVFFSVVLLAVLGAGLAWWFRRRRELKELAAFKPSARGTASRPAVSKERKAAV